MKLQQEREAMIAKKLSLRSRHHQHQYNNVVTLQSAGIALPFAFRCLVGFLPFRSLPLGIHMIDYLNDSDAKTGVMYVSSVVR